MDELDVTVKPVEAWHQDEPLTGKPVDTAPAGNIMSINDCPACGGKHTDLIIKESNRPSAAGTHWYLCPTLGDPCFVTLAAVQTGEAIELDGPVCQALARAQMSGQWLVMVAHMQQDGSFRYNRMAFKFPHAKFEELIGHFSKDLGSEIGPLQPAKMAEAGPLPSLVNVFGDGANTPLD